MALWEVTSNGKTSIEYSEQGYSTSNPGTSMHVRRHFYKVPFTNVGKGGILRTSNGTFHTPSWVEVHERATLDDIIVEKKPFQELFVEPESWQFKSSSSDKTYTVRRNASGKLSCDCWGYIAHKKCKHIKQVQE